MIDELSRSLNWSPALKSFPKSPLKACAGFRHSNLNFNPYQKTKPRRWLQAQRRGSICLILRRASMSVPPDDDALAHCGLQPRRACLRTTGRRLEDVENEVGPFVIRTWSRVIAKPMAVVHWDPHLGRIAVVQAVGAAVVLVAPIVLRVVHVRVMVEPFPIERVVSVAPGAAIGLLIGLNLARRPNGGGQHKRRNGKIDPADHRSP